jgi:hypothetical protein
MATRIPTFTDPHSSNVQRPLQRENNRHLYPEIQTTEKVAECFKCKMLKNESEMSLENRMICDNCSKRWSWKPNFCVDVVIPIALASVGATIFLYLIGPPN